MNKPNEDDRRNWEQFYRDPGDGKTPEEEASDSAQMPVGAILYSVILVTFLALFFWWVY